MDYQIVKGDLANFEADVIVNAANPWLAPGAGVCGAIFAKADFKALGEECRTVLLDLDVSQLEVGDIAITSAPGMTTCQRIVHAVGPKYNDQGLAAGILLLEECYYKAMSYTSAVFSSIAFPVIGAGVYGWPYDIALRVAKETIKDFQNYNNNFKTATIVEWDGS